MMLASEMILDSNNFVSLKGNDSIIIVFTLFTVSLFNLNFNLRLSNISFIDVSLSLKFNVLAFVVACSMFNT